MRAFISYSHKDEGFLEPFKTCLTPIAAANGIEIWSDTDIPTGAFWKQHIMDRIATADLFFPLVSPHFMASDFIMKEEIPRMIARGGAGGALLLPVILRRCAWQMVFQWIQVTPVTKGKLRPVGNWTPQSDGFDRAREEITNAITSRTPVPSGSTS